MARARGTGCVDEVREEGRARGADYECSGRGEMRGEDAV